MAAYAKFWSLEVLSESLRFCRFEPRLFLAIIWQLQEIWFEHKIKKEKSIKLMNEKLKKSKLEERGLKDDQIFG